MRMPAKKNIQSWPLSVSISEEHDESKIGKNKFVLSIITKAASFFSIFDEWDNLLANSSADTFFLTSEWLKTWWEVFGHKYQMHVVIVRDSNERLLAAAPLMIYETNLPFVKYENRALRFIGYGDEVTPEHLSLIIRQGYEKDVLPTLLDHIVDNDEFNVIDLKPITNNNTIFESIISELSAKQFNYQIECFSKCPIMRLPSSWETHMANSSKNFRKKSKEYLRICQRDLNTNFRRVEDASELEKSMQDLAELHRHRWGNKTRAFRSKAYLTFHTMLAKRLFRKNRLRLCFLEQFGNPLAAFYGFRYRDCYYYYQSGRNLAYERYHLGYVLMNYCIQEAIDEGAATFDFLTGAEEYKSHWANDCKRNYQIRAYRDRNFWYLYRMLNIFGGTLKATGIK